MHLKSKYAQRIAAIDGNSKRVSDLELIESWILDTVMQREETLTDIADACYDNPKDFDCIAKELKPEKFKEYKKNPLKFKPIVISIRRL